MERENYSPKKYIDYPSMAKLLKTKIYLEGFPFFMSSFLLPRSTYKVTTYAGYRVER